MIVVQQRPDEETRTPGKSCHWVASTIVDGVTYRARSRRGAPNELARVLVAAGIPDQPMEVYTHGLAGSMSYRPLYALAGTMMVENASEPVHRARYRSPEDQFGHLRNRDLAGGKPPALVQERAALKSPEFETA